MWESRRQARYSGPCQSRARWRPGLPGLAEQLTHHLGHTHPRSECLGLGPTSVLTSPGLQVPSSAWPGPTHWERADGCTASNGRSSTILSHGPSRAVCSAGRTLRHVVRPGARKNADPQGPRGPREGTVTSASPWSPGSGHAVSVLSRIHTEHSASRFLTAKRKQPKAKQKRDQGNWNSPSVYRRGPGAASPHMGTGSSFQLTTRVPETQVPGPLHHMGDWKVGRPWSNTGVQVQSVRHVQRAEWL